MTQTRIDPDYPVKLNQFADRVVDPTIANVLHEAAAVAQSLLNALQAAQPDLEDDEAIISVRITKVPGSWHAEVPHMTPPGMTSISIASGRDIDPGMPLLLLAAHDAIVACAGSAGHMPCDNGETIQ